MNTNVTRFGRPRRRRSLLVSAACSLAFTVVFSALLLLGLAFVAYRNDDPTKLLVPFAVGALALASFVCGIAGAKFRGGQGLVVGALSGAFFTLAVALISFAFEGVSAPEIEKNYLLYAAIPLLAAFGGIVGNTRKESKPRRRRH